ncbi:MAG: NAD(P)-dependent oxidoreductase [Alphaproteobacteria bacterium]|nr:NAD(P)-dependent oxidoreductase [Alphaproteobacteria bacterium]
MATLEGRVMFITGASRGIGLAIALRAARAGARIALLAKTVEPHPKLPGTIHSAAAEIEAAGGEALPIQGDVRSEDQVQAAVEQAVERWGGIDICVNNASAISMTGTLETPVKMYDLMHQINLRGTWITSRACLPYLLRAERPHILNLGPPLNMNPKWFAGSCAYTMAKYGMSMCTLGMAEEFRGRVAVNSLWPQTTIATAAIWNRRGRDFTQHCRKPEIMADAAHAILTRPVSYSGHFCIDEAVLREEGVEDFDAYACVPGARLQLDLFLDDWVR